MSLKTVVKVGNITNLSDARYCSGMGVQYLGFSLDKNSASFIDKETLQSIKEWVVGPDIVGELTTSDPGLIGTALATYPIDCIEITHPELLSELSGKALRIILRLDLSSFESTPGLTELMKYAQDKVSFFLLEQTAGTSIPDSDILALTQEFRIMLAYSIDKESVNRWIEGSSIYGIALHGGSEIKPGFKDYDELADILEELEVD